MPTTRATFPALGTSVDIAVRSPRDFEVAVRIATRVLADVDATCSRFRPDSDLTVANGRAGEWVEVDPLLVAAVAVSVDAAHQTGGLVNPLLGRELVTLGYDRDFHLLRLAEDRPADQPTAVDPDAWRQLRLDPEGAIRVPPGTCLDLGATGKSFAADLIATAYADHLSGSALVNVGGDLRVAAPDGQPWLVGVAERAGGAPDELVHLLAGGLATSTTTMRRWTRRGVRRHHLLDPTTGLPADDVWRTVTALGDTCTAANTASTAAVVLGPAAPAWLDARSVTARLVAREGSVVRLGAWPGERSAA